MTSLLIAPEALAARRAAAARGGDLGTLADRLSRHVDALLAHPVYVPEAKALLSRWGAHCRDDEAELAFDPWSPRAQRCPTCGRIWNDEQAHRWWVYWYQLWLAERVWLLALHAGPGGRPDAEARALELLAAIADRYPGYSNADNVLGPSRPFFSTYLESVWVLQLAAAASLLEAMGRLPVGLAGSLRETVFAPSAALIADFDEGRSNRQTWNAAARFALARVLGDDAGARTAAHGPGGILVTLDAGLLDDGLWYEGENYHWFALRGLVWGAELLREAGDLDLWSDGGSAGRKFREAFRAPVLTALPDFTFPARRDSKFGVSLRQRRMAELWELAMRRGTEAQGHGGTEQTYASLLAHVYDPAVPAAEPSGAEITDVERREPAGGVRRDALGWKGLLWMSPELPAAPPEAWRPGSVHLEATGLAIVRRDEGRSYVSLDYGEPGGGHGHPDRLNLTLAAGGVPWLLDFGTGSYVAPSLAWYRTTLAHNAPLVDGISQAPARGVCVAWDEADPYAWICAQLPEGGAYEGALLQRTIVLAPGYLLDVVQMLSTSGERQLALPWHGLGELSLDEAGLAFTRDGGGGLGGGALAVRLAGRQRVNVSAQRAPGPPTGADTPEIEFAIVFAAGEEVTLAACLDLGAGVTALDCVDDAYVVHLGEGRIHRHQASDTGWAIELDRGDPVALGGLRDLPEPAPPAPPPPPTPPGAAESAPAARCPRVAAVPRLDGTLDGVDTSRPLHLDRADQFRRADDVWEGAEHFSALAFLNHDGEHLYLGVDVVAPEPRFRPADAPDPEWENENPCIHSDGVQVYAETASGVYGWLLVPNPNDQAHVVVSAVRGTDGEVEMVTRRAWRATERGYRLTIALDVPDALVGTFGFDLAVNRARPGRERRTAQLVWSGAHGERLYLAGDRRPPTPMPRVKVE